MDENIEAHASAHKIPDLREITDEELQYLPYVRLRLPGVTLSRLARVEPGGKVSIRPSSLRNMLEELEDSIAEIRRQAYEEGFAAGTGNKVEEITKGAL
jgi:hypothetical protein